MVRPAAMEAWRLLPIVDVLLQAADEGSLVDRLLPRFRDVIPCDSAVWWVERGGDHTARSAPRGLFTAADRRLLGCDAIIRWDNDAAVRRSDLPESTPGPNSLAFGFRHIAGRRDRIVLRRTGADFTPADLLLAEALRPRIEAAMHRLSPPTHPQWMTAREMAVLDLVVQGLTNKQIASRLGISPRTVGKHLEHSYAKLNEPCRVGAAMRWRTSGPVQSGNGHSDRSML